LLLVDYTEAPRALTITTLSLSLTNTLSLGYGDALSTCIWTQWTPLSFIL